MPVIETLHERLDREHTEATLRDYSGDYEVWLEDKAAQLEAYCDKLADGLPEGMLPKDIEILRKANADMAERIAQLEGTLTFIGDIAYDRDGYTGDAEKLGKLVDEIYKYARNPEEVLKTLGR